MGIPARRFQRRTAFRWWRPEFTEREVSLPAREGPFCRGNDGQECPSYGDKYATLDFRLGSVPRFSNLCVNVGTLSKENSR